jgi:hypothetical protein
VNDESLQQQNKTTHLAAVGTTTKIETAKS